MLPCRRHLPHDILWHVEELFWVRRAAAPCHRPYQALGLPRRCLCTGFPATVALLCGVQQLPPCSPPGGRRWHKEDIDLYSINYLHFGAPKVTVSAAWLTRMLIRCMGVRSGASVTMSPPAALSQQRPQQRRCRELSAAAMPSPLSWPRPTVLQIWYCVSPKDNPKFEAMAQALYPDLYRNCHGFMRHKVDAGRPLGGRARGGSWLPSVVHLAWVSQCTPARQACIPASQACMALSGAVAKLALPCPHPRPARRTS